MHLTPSEVEILSHRLEVGDCIAECFTDTGDDEPPCLWSFDEIMEVAKRLLAGLPHLPDSPTTLEAEILEDCLTGSTLMQAAEDNQFPVSEGGIGKGKYLSMCKAASSLEVKISQLLGRNVEVNRR